MAKKPTRKAALAQNFLKSPKLARMLICASTIVPSDTVYEIGAGRGVITAELACKAHKVVAIEKDAMLVQRLHSRFQNLNNVQIVESDFLRYRVVDKGYKIFANIPYNITADIVRKILYVPPVASEAYLIMQREAAEKFSGSPKETQFSIMAKPQFAMQIVHHLRRTDFDPVPGVDSVLLHIRKRSPPLIRGKDVSLYRSFVRFGFGRRKKSLKLSFKPLFTYEQWRRMSRRLHFPLDATPTDLTFDQWLGLFYSFIERVPGNKWIYLNKK